MHSLDVVAVGVEQEGCVVAAAVFRAVPLADAGRAVIPIAAVDARPVEGIDLIPRVGDERDVNRTPVLLVVGDDEVRELRPVISLPKRRYPERFEDDLVERDAVPGVSYANVDVVEDDPRPIPVERHRVTLAPAPTSRDGATRRGALFALTKIACEGNDVFLRQVAYGSRRKAESSAANQSAGDELAADEEDDEDEPHGRTRRSHATRLGVCPLLAYPRAGYLLGKKSAILARRVRQNRLMAGRPTVLTAKTQAQLGALLDAGIPQVVAARAVGISPRSVARFMARQREPAAPETLEEALDSLPGLDDVLADLDRPRPRRRRTPKPARDWQASARWLEVELPDRWAPPDDDAA
jgi:hypothetical protein